MMPFQRHRKRYEDNYPTGGCTECGGICGGAKTPKELMEMVLQHVEDGHLTGGQVARIIQEYVGSGMEGEGFWSDFASGFKSVFKPLASVAKVGLSLVPHPGAQVASQALGALGAGRTRRTSRVPKAPMRKRRVTRK